MKTIIEMFLKPRQALNDIISREPVFSGIAVFIASVIIGNINTVRKFSVNPQSGIFYSLILVVLWLAALVFANLIITLVLKAINPASSALLDVERFRKLFIAQLFIAEIIIIKPLLSFFMGDRLSWVLVAIWSAVLILITVVNLWNITEIKAVVAAISAVIIMYIISGPVLTPPSGYDPNQFLKLKSFAKKSLTGPRVNLLGVSRTDFGSRVNNELIDIAENYIGSYGRDSAYGYALGLKAAVLAMDNKVREAEILYRDILSSGDTVPPLSDSAELNFYELVSDKKFITANINRASSRWETILRFLKIPDKFAGYRPNIRDISLIRSLISSASGRDLEKFAERISLNWKGTVFEDDILFWIAEKFLKAGDLQNASFYYRRAASAELNYDEKRMESESVIYYIERLSGEPDIFKEKIRAPQALSRLAWLLQRELRDIDSARAVYDEILTSYTSSIFAADALFELAQLSEEEGDFDQAVRLYSSLLNRYEVSDLRSRARHKINIISSNLQNKELLADYSRGWKMWQSGNNEGAIRLYRDIINNYQDSEIACELQYNIGLYYRKRGYYKKALDEFKTGYDKFRDTARGLDFALRAGDVIGEDLGDWRRLVEWNKFVLSEFETDHITEISKVEIIDLAWETADIYVERLKDYDGARGIYLDIAARYSDKNTVARAIYKTAYLDELERRYKDAVALYREIIAGYLGTGWAKLAAGRMEDIYQRGTELLEKSR